MACSFWRVRGRLFVGTAKVARVRGELFVGVVTATIYGSAHTVFFGIRLRRYPVLSALLV